MNKRLFAFFYDLVMWPVERFYLRRLRRELLEPSRGRVLEIGAGTGANLRLYGAGANVVLSEPDWAMLRQARLDGVPAVLAEAERLPFPDASFDTVVSTLVLCTVGDPDAAFAEIGRVLAPGGTALLLEHVRSLDPAKARLQSRLTPAWMRIAAGCHLDRDTAGTLLGAGFRIQSMRRLVPVRLLPLIVVQAVRPD